MTDAGMGNVMSVVDARRVERRVHGKWVPVDFKDLTSGCTFRMYEADGTLVYDEHGKDTWIAASKPFVKDHHWTIKIYKR